MNILLQLTADFTGDYSVEEDPYQDPDSLVHVWTLYVASFAVFEYSGTYPIRDPAR